MGQQLSLLMTNAPAVAVSSYISEMGNMQYESTIGNSRFLKTVNACDDKGLAVVKLFIKPSLDFQLQDYAEKLRKEREALKYCAGTLPYEEIIETDRAGYLVRQYIRWSLYDRISTRPFLEYSEKKWIVFQLLKCLEDCHSAGVCHGDIKSENILVTSWNWTFLTDFASFKPTHLPDDNPSQFFFYFDTSQRRNCYLAPERFFTPAESSTRELERPELTPAMDIFSLGCVIAELYLEGSSIFSLAQLFKYKSGEYIPDLSAIEDPNVREMVSDMIQVDPQARHSAAEYLLLFRKRIFPEHFYTFLYEYSKALTEPPGYVNDELSSSDRAVECDDRISTIYGDLDKICYFLQDDEEEPPDEEKEEEKEKTVGRKNSSTSSGPVNTTGKHPESKTCYRNSETALIFLSVVFSSLRNCSRASSRVKACELILELGYRVHDEAKLDRCVPYLASLFEDPRAEVQAAALRNLTSLVASIEVVTPINALLFPEYLLPRLKTLLAGASAYTRMIFTSCLPSLATSALDISKKAETLQMNVLRRSIDPETENGISVETDAVLMSSSALSEPFEEFTISLLTDPDPAVKIALLHNVLPLCRFLGREKTTDIVLSHLITYLNDRHARLRLAFVGAVPGIAVWVGPSVLEHYILPLLVQTLADPEEFVAVAVVQSFVALCRLRLIRRHLIHELLRSVLPLVYHPNQWLRQGSLGLVETVAAQLSQAEIYCMFYPMIRSYLDAEVTDFSLGSLYLCAKHPLARNVYSQALSWATGAGDSQFWQTGDTAIGTVSEKDRDWFATLRASGLVDSELYKLKALREYIYRVARLRPRMSAGQLVPDEKVSFVNGRYDIQTVVRPQTVFFDSPEDSTVSIHAPLYELGDENYGIARWAEQPDVPASESSLRSVSESAGSAAGSEVMLFGTAKAQAVSSMNSESVFGSISEPSDLHTVRPVSGGAADLTGRSSGNTEPRVFRMTPTLAGDSEASYSVTRAKCVDLSTGLNHTYSGTDHYVLKCLSKVEIEPELDLFEEFGPIVTSFSSKKVDREPESAAPRVWTPSGVIVAQLTEHNSAVTRLAVSADHKYLVSASEDGTVKLWDSQRLADSVAGISELTLSFGSAVGCLCFVSNRNCVLVGTRDGTVRLIRFAVSEYSPEDLVGAAGLSARPGLRVGAEFSQQQKYGSPELLGEFRFPNKPGEYAVDIAFYEAVSLPTALLLTSRGRLVALDIRKMDPVFTGQNPLSHGVCNRLLVDPDGAWAVVGTSRGIVDVWDLRFKIHLKAWGLPGGFPITDMQLYPVDRVKGHTSNRKSRWICIAGGTGANEVTVWDISRSQCREVYMGEDRAAQQKVERLSPSQKYEARKVDMTGLMSDLPDDLDNVDLNEMAKTLVENLDALKTDFRGDGKAAEGSVENTIRTLGTFCLDEQIDRKTAYMVTCGTDLRTIVWNLARINHSVVLSGEKWEKRDESQFSVAQPSQHLLIVSQKYKQNSSGSEKVRKKTPRTTVISQEQQELTRNHHDVVTAMAVLLRPWNMVVTADRTGIINVYK